MEELSYRRDQKATKGLGGINMSEVRNNRALLLDGGYEVQSSLIIKIFRAIRV